MTIQTDIEKLAQEVAKEALSADNLQSKVDALKTLGPYYLALIKGRKNVETSDEPTLDDIRSHLRAVEG